ncbi:MAG: Outer-membrane lipoprotein carrier protein [Desulfovibrio sp.]
MCRLLRLFFGVALLGACAFSSPAAAESVIDSLQKKNAALTSFSCAFTQETRIPLFDSPVISEGRMAFMRPDGLRWEYVSPMREGFAVQGGKGLRWREGAAAQEVASVTDDPLLAMIARELVTWVTLDMDRIEKQYTVTVTETDPPTFHLVPKQRETRSVLASLTIVFASSGLARSVTIAETQGGETGIRFADGVINRPVNIMERP